MPLLRGVLSWLAVCGVLVSMQASAQASVQAKAQKKNGRPTVGLVLGGGGARGLAHVGVLKVLEQQRVPIDCIAGTSMGALVGGVFATGMPVAEMERRVREADWDEFFSNRIKRQEEVFVRKEDDRVNTSNLRIPARNGRIGLPRGAVRTQKIELFIRELTQSLYPENFSALPIPFRAIGTDLENGRVVEFDRGDLALAMRASMSVPGLFDPVEYKGRLVVDGGLARNLPVDNVLALCNPDVLIVVNVGTPPLNREEMSSALGVTQQMVDVGINNNIAQQLSRLTSNDILIEPKLGDLTSGDFSRNAEFIPLGEQAAFAQTARLQALSLSPQEYAEYKAERGKRQVRAGKVDAIRVAPLRVVNPQLVNRMISQRAGEPFDQPQLHRDILQLYGRGDFDRIDYTLQNESGKQVLALSPYEKAAGPDEIHLGLRVQSELGSSTQFDLSAAYYKTWANRWGAIWKTHFDLGSNPLLATEWYQPLDFDSPWFVAPYYLYSRVSHDVYFQSREQVAQYLYTTRAAGLSLGYSLGEWGELRTGPVWSKVHYQRHVGDPQLPEQNDDNSGWRARLVFDKVDNAKFPNNGVYGTVNGYWARKGLHGDSNYQKYSADWLGAYNVGGNVLSVALRSGNGKNLPYYEYFRLGGLFNLTGYHQDEFAGDVWLYGRVGYARRWNTPYANGLYGGIMVEAGNAWLPGEARSNASVKSSAALYVGADTGIGPLYFGYGRGEAGRNALYLLIGSSDLSFRR